MLWFLLGVAVGSSSVDVNNAPAPQELGVPPICVMQVADKDEYYKCRAPSAAHIPWVSWREGEKCNNLRNYNSSYMCLDDFITREWDMLQKIIEKKGKQP